MPRFRHLIVTIVIAALAVGCRADRATNPLPAIGHDVTTPSPQDIPDIQFPIVPAWASIQIFDVHGAVVRTILLDLNSDSHEIEWDGRTDSGLLAASGVYVYRIEFSDGSEVVRRLVLVR